VGISFSLQLRRQTSFSISFYSYFTPIFLFKFLFHLENVESRSLDTVNETKAELNSTLTITKTTKTNRLKVSQRENKKRRKGRFVCAPTLID
jgi:hypothetical protein